MALFSSSSLERAYARLPVAAQNAVCWWYGWKQRRLRFSDSFHRHLARLRDSEKWSRSEIEAYQNGRLRELIRHAYENIPFYRSRMAERKLVPDDFRSVADLPKLPVLTKEDVRQNARAMISRGANTRALVHFHTSGTTGTSLHFYRGRDSIAFQWALWWRHRARFGVQWGTRHANFTGKLVVPPDQERPPYWRWSGPIHQALLNMHHITPSKIGAILSFLDAEAFQFYTGYPSIIHALVLAAREAGIELHARPGLISTGAENILDYQRADIEAFTGAILTDHYGSSEGCGNASTCERFLYHEDFEFGILECVDAAPQDGGRKKGNILCTGFACPEFPFIRYEVGDVGVWEAPAVQCKCGRQSASLVAIEGRMDDYVVTPEGRRIMRFDYIFKDTHKIRESQVVQEEPGWIKVRVVRRPGYQASDEQFVRDEIRRWISPRLGVRFEYVKEIERERNGKFRAVKSLLPHSGAASTRA